MFVLFIVSAVIFVPCASFVNVIVPLYIVPYVCMKFIGLFMIMFLFIKSPIISIVSPVFISGRNIPFSLKNS